MTKVRVNAFSVSIDGYGAGASQSVENPLGVHGDELHHWYYPIKNFRKTIGESEPRSGVDDDFAKSGMENIGAWIMGRNMFGPIRGPWPDDKWQGWWGEKPP